MTKPLISWRPFTNMKTAPMPIEILRAKDTLIFDKNGRQYIDAISSWWVITHGHCHPYIVEAVTKTAQSLDQVVFGNFTHAPARNLLAKLGALLPQELSAAFFSDNGSTSVEVALKVAIQFWQLYGHRHKNKIVSFLGAYHGDTAGCMSVSARGLFSDPYQKMLFDVVRFEDASTSLTENTAALIIEPLVQGAGGMIMWDKSSLLHIIHEARKKNIIIIFDEVMTGFFRTGALFAFEKIDFVPDILCLSKGLTGGFLPLALTICNNRIYEAFLSNEPSKMFFHGHSFTANPLSCAAAVANLCLINSSTKEKVRNIEQYHQTRLSKINSPLIKDKRQQGAIAAIELNDECAYLSKYAASISKYALSNGVYLRPLGNVIYTMPPYCISDAELSQVWDVIEMSIKNLEG